MAGVAVVAWCAKSEHSCQQLGRLEPGFRLAGANCGFVKLPDCWLGVLLKMVRHPDIDRIVRAVCVGQPLLRRQELRKDLQPDPGGRRVYFLFPRHRSGRWANWRWSRRRRSSPSRRHLGCPGGRGRDGGGVAYWVALTRRAPIQPGATVLVNGAAGGMAVQIARHFGAHRIVVVGRNRDRLNDLDADIRIALDDDADAALHAQFDRSVDVTLDFLWGQPTARTIAIAATKDRGAPNGRAQVPIRPAWDCRGNRERCRFRRPSKTLSDDRTALRGFGGMFL